MTLPLRGKFYLFEFSVAIIIESHTGETSILFVAKVSHEKKTF